jgi:hypothetical protein
MQKAKLDRRYRDLCRKLAPKGWICTGSAIVRSYERETAGRRKQFGPYYSWTRKVNNRTVTTALSKEQFQVIQEAIKRRQEIERILTTMQEVSIANILALPSSLLRRKRERGP